MAKVPGSIAAPPVSGTFDPSVLEKLSPEQQTLCDDFTAFVSELSACGLAFSEKRSSKTSLTASRANRSKALSTLGILI